MLMVSGVWAQSITPVKICDLPVTLGETSGLEGNGANKFLTHNDSGNEPLVYVFDSSGAIKRSIRITNAGNTDWEDLSKDNKGNIYIGDFGNNNNDRNNLKVYIIADPNTFSKDSTIATILNFSYPDQKAFPPSADQQNFDMEAFFWFKDSLYLFSKNRSTPYSGYTKCYQLPAKSGTYTARLIDSFYTGNGSYLNYSITSAAINGTGNKVVLLGYDKCWIFSGFSGNRFLKGKVDTYYFSGLTQKEAVYFENDYQLLFTQETSVLGNAGLYRAYLPNPANWVLNQKEKYEFEIFPNPSSDFFEVSVQASAKTIIVEAAIFDGKGIRIKLLQLEIGQINTIDWSDLPAGSYFLKLCNGQSKKLLKL